MNKINTKYKRLESNKNKKELQLKPTWTKGMVKLVKFHETSRKEFLEHLQVYEAQLLNCLIHHFSTTLYTIAYLHLIKHLRWRSCQRSLEKRLIDY